MNMNQKDLIVYELPVWVEFVSNSWLQTIIGRYYGKKVLKKLARFQKRKKMEEFLQANK